MQGAGQPSTSHQPTEMVQSIPSDEVAIHSDELADDAIAKKRKRHSSLFGYKDLTRYPRPTTESAEVQLAKYIELINRDDFDPEGQACVYTKPEYEKLWPLFSRLWCVPATSAPVERIFSQSGLLMRPHRAKMSDDLLETLMFLKCNAVA